MEEMWSHYVMNCHKPDLEVQEMVVRHELQCLDLYMYIYISKQAYVCE